MPSAFRIAFTYDIFWTTLQRCLASIPFEGLFRALIMLGCIPMYIHDIRRLKDMLDVISPRQRTLSFQKFVRDYAAGSDFRNIICGCVLIAASISWTAESQRPYVADDWTFPQAFLAIAVTYALSGLGLSNLYTRGLWTVALSRGGAELWTQHAAHSLASGYINIAIALSTTEAWAKGAVIFFVASQIASTFRLDTNQDSAEGESGGRLLQYATLVVGVLIVFVSLYMARIFCRLTKLSAPTATQRVRPTRPVLQLTGITSL